MRNLKGLHSLENRVVNPLEVFSSIAALTRRSKRQP